MAARTHLPPPPRAPSGAKSVAIGMMAGVTEVACQQPLVSWRIALQQARKPSFLPRDMYRGTAINALAVAPVTGIQFGAFAALSAAGASPVLAAAVAGASSVRTIMSSCYVVRLSSHNCSRRHLPKYTNVGTQLSEPLWIF
jgi:hypothetical protein